MLNHFQDEFNDGSSNAKCDYDNDNIDGDAERDDNNDNGYDDDNVEGGDDIEWNDGDFEGDDNNSNLNNNDDNNFTKRTRERERENFEGDNENENRYNDFVFKSSDQTPPKKKQYTKQRRKERQNITIKNHRFRPNHGRYGHNSFPNNALFKLWNLVLHG